MKYAAFVITFDRPERLRESLHSLLEQSRRPEKILVVDNGRHTEVTRKVTSGLPRDIVSHHCTSGNLGPAGAAEIGLSWALERGFDWVYWGDDDDPPQTEDTLSRLLTLAEGNDQHGLGAVAAVGGRWDWGLGQLRRLDDAELSGPISVDSVGGGGQLLVSRTAVERAGLPEPQLFFGWEEIELCLRIRRAGLEILVDGDLMYKYRLHHGRLGRPSQSRGTELLPPWRQYYSSRNYIYLMRRKFNRPDLARREALRSLARMVLSWRKGLHFGAKFSAFQLRALGDGYRDRMGLTLEPEAKLRLPTGKKPE